MYFVIYLASPGTYERQFRDSIENELLKANEAISNAEAEVGRFDAAFQNAEQEHQAATEVLTGVREDFNQIKEQENEINGRLDERMRERHELQVCVYFFPFKICFLNAHATLQAQQRSIGESVKNADKRIEKAQKSIQEETQRLQDLNGGSHARRLEEYQQQETEVENSRNRFKEHQRGMDRLQEDSLKAEEDLKIKTAPIARQRSDIQQAEGALQNLTKERGHQSDGFHERMPILLRAIQQETSFGNRPIGPLGQHVRLLKPKWSAVLENSFGGTLGSFLVSTKKDMNILFGIMQRVNWYAPIPFSPSALALR